MQLRAEAVQRITQALAPARRAIEQAVSALDTAAAAFDPEAIIAAPNDAVNSLADVLQDPEITAALNQIRDVIGGATQQIESLSFAPITDQVINVIAEMTAALAAIDPAQIPEPAAAALSAAVMVLPADLAPATDPITVEFGALIESGPIPLLEQVRQVPAKLLEQVTRFEPARLIGAGLSQPFNSLIRELEAFRPSELLDPLERELDPFKETLLRAASPSRALEPLAAPFAEITEALGRLDPRQITQPIEDALSQTVDRLMSVLPVEDLFAAIDQVLNVVRRVLDAAGGVSALLRRIHGLAEALGTAPADLEAWIDEVLARVEALPDAAALNIGVVALRAAVDASRGAALLPRFDALTAGARTTLSTIDGTTRLTGIITAYHSVSRPALEALPDSATRSALLGALDRFNPIDPAFGVPFKALGDQHDAVNGVRSTLQARAAAWDARFHHTGGALASLRRDSATPARLRQSAPELLDAQLVQPVSALVGFLEPVRAVLAAVLDALDDLLSHVRERADALLLGPDSVAGLRAALGDIVAHVTDLNLDFLEESLDALFASVQGKLAALEPARLAQPLDETFKAVLDTIDIDLVLPQAQRAALDAIYNEFVDKLRALEPGALVTAAIQPLWDETVLPMLATFDLTPVFDALIEKLRLLDEDLRAKLLRVNGSYQVLLGAVPALNASAGISL